MRPTVCVVLCFSLAATLAPEVARAQRRDAATADSLFRQAKTDEEHGDYVTACARLAESQRLNPTTGTLLNEADCEEHVGKIATAWAHFVEARGGLKAGDERVAYAQQRIAALQGRVPHLSLRLRPDAPVGARILRGQDPVSAAMLNIPLATDPGLVTLTVTAPAHVAHVETVTLLDGESREVVLSAGPQEISSLATVAGLPIPPAAAAPPFPSPPPPPPPPAFMPAPLTPVPPLRARVTSAGIDRRRWSWVAGGIGVAGIGVGAISGALAVSAASTFKSHCSASGACDAQGLNAASSGATYSTLSTAGFVVGALGLGTGVFLRLTSSPAVGSTVVGAAPVASGAIFHVTQGF